MRFFSGKFTINVDCDFRVSNVLQLLYKQHEEHFSYSVSPFSFPVEHKLLKLPEMTIKVI